MIIGYIGLGAMGSALARHLIADHELVVRDLNRNAVDELVKLGASTVGSAAELARKCDLVILCLPRSANVEQVIFGPDGLVEGLSAGKTVIDQTSGIPTATFGFAERLAELGVEMIDAPVAGGVPSALAGSITIMTSGSDLAHEQAVPVLKTISPKVYRCSSRVGDAQAVKLVNNTINAGYRMATLEVVALGRKLGLSLEVMTEALQNGWGHNFSARQLLPAIIEKRQSNNFALQLMVKDLNQSLALGMECGVPLPIAGLARGLMQIGVNTIGERAELDDLVTLTDTLSGTKMAATVEADASGRANAEGPATRSLTVGIAGLGAGDGGFVRHLMQRHQVQLLGTEHVWQQEGIADGAIVASDVASLVRDCDVILVGDMESSAIVAALAGIEAGEGAGNGKLLIDLTPRPFTASAQLAEELASKGVAMLDVATTAEPGSGLDDADALLCGGPTAAFAQARPLLDTLCAKLIHCGRNGHAQLAKAIVDTVAVCNRVVVYENAAVGVKLGLDIEAMARVVNDGSGWSKEGERIWPALSTGARTTDLPLRQVVEALNGLTQQGFACGAPMLIANEVRTLYETCANEAGEDAGLDAMASHFEAMAGVVFKRQ